VPESGPHLEGNIVGRRLLVICVLLAFAMFVSAGCASSGSSAGPRAYQGLGPQSLTPDAVNAMTNAFADDHVVRVKEASLSLRAESPSIEDRALLNIFRLKDAHAIFGIASSSNPNVGMIDMLVAISLQREALRRRAIDRTLTETERRQPDSYDIDDEQLEGILRREDRILLGVFTESEREIRALAGKVLYPEQIEQLDSFIEQWWANNPGRRFVSQVRLEDFAAARGATVETVSGGARNILGLLYLDPLASMDPTTREIAQTRMLADRLAYQFMRFPLLASMYVRAIMYEAITLEEVVAVTQSIEGTEASLTRFAEVAERWPQDVATEREAAIADFEAAVARQRDDLLRAIDERAEPLQGTLSQLEATLKTAHELSGSVTETIRSIDDMTTRMYERSSSEEPANIADVQQLADSAVEGVGGVERSLGAIERLLAPETVDDDARSRVDRGLTVATASSRALVDHVFWRGVQLAVIVLVGWVIAATISRLLAGRLAPRPRGDR